MAVAICGYGRHGKGTVASLLTGQSGLVCKESTSEGAARVVYEKLKDEYGYKSIEECWNDRHQHRAEWAETIWRYNEPYGLTLYVEMLHESDILEGVRKSAELQALKDVGLVDVVIWVDATKRLPPEDPASCQVTPDDADVVIDNNGPASLLPLAVSQVISDYGLSSDVYAYSHRPVVEGIENGSIVPPILGDGSRAGCGRA